MINPTKNPYNIDNNLHYYITGTNYSTTNLFYTTNSYGKGWSFRIFVNNTTSPITGTYSGFAGNNGYVRIIEYY